MCNAVDQRDFRHTGREAAQFPQAASARPTRTSTRNRQACSFFSSEDGDRVPYCRNRYECEHEHDHRRGGDGGLSGGAGRGGQGGVCVGR